MRDSTRIKYIVTLIPKGESQTDVSSVREVSFESEYDDRLKNKSELKKELTNRGSVDAYALRNHWDLHRLDAEFVNEPWETWEDMANDIEAFDNVRSVGLKTIKGVLAAYIAVEEGTEQDVVKRLDEYYPVFKPTTRDAQITICPQSALLSLRCMYN